MTDPLSRRLLVKRRSHAFALTADWIELGTRAAYYLQLESIANGVTWWQPLDTMTGRTYDDLAEAMNLQILSRKDPHA